MERDAHYFVVGLFVIVMAVAGFLFAGLFYEHVPDAAVTQYDIHFDTSVEGLEKGSEVRYMGVKVGEVTRVFLLPGTAARVGIRIRVDAQTPVTRITVATLRQQGLTGLPFINLAQDSALGKPEPLKALAGQELPVIYTKPSDLDALLYNLPKLEQNLNQLVTSANEVLNAENRAHFAGLLKNLDTASADVPQLLTSLKQTSQQLQTLIGHVDAALKRTERGLAGNMQELQATLASIRTTSQRLDTLVRDIDRVVVDNTGNVQGLLTESRKMAAAIRRLSDSLEQNPSQIIYPPAPQGTELPP